MSISEIEAQIEQLLKQNVGVQRIKAQLHVGQSAILAVKDRLGLRSTKNNPKPAAPKKAASIAPSIPEYTSPSIPEKSEYTSSIPDNHDGAQYEPDMTRQGSKPAAKPGGHVDPNPISHLHTTTLIETPPFSGASAGQDSKFVDFEPEFSLKDKLKAQSALEAILGRDKRAIGGMVWPGLQIAKAIIDKLLE